MDDPPGTVYGGLLGSTKEEVAGIFGDPRAMRFADGHEVWAYDYGRAEVVVLFDPAGEVTKARLRSAP